MSAARIVSVDGVELAVRQWGDSGGVPVLFWHALGALTTGAYAAELAEPLIARGARVIAPDGPGHGESPPLPREQYGFDSTADLAVGLLDALGAGRTVFVGHSWGASVAVHVGARYPDHVSALVLLDAAFADAAEQPDFEVKTYEQRLAEAQTRREELRWATWEEFDAALRDDLPRWSPALQDVFRAGLREDDGSIVTRVSPEARAAVQDALYAASIPATWPAIAAARLPVLLLLATEPPALEDYRAGAVERFLAALPGADVRRMEGCGHDLVVDLGPKLGDVIGDWLVERGLLSRA